MPRRPRIFIGSSTAGQDYADALHARLDLKSEATVWNHAVWHLTKSTLENLVEQARKADFAALVLTPDDLLTRGEEERSVARDNVLFEAGLFMGTLGPERTFLVSCRDNEIALPTDLAGITQARWGDRSDGNWDAALSVPAREILQAMKDVRLRDAQEETLFDFRKGFELGAWDRQYHEGARADVKRGENEVIRIERQNGHGKLWLWLSRSVPRGDGGETVMFRISGDARTSEGEHTVVFVFKDDDAPPGEHLGEDLRTRFASRWQSLDATKHVTLNRSCRIRIEHRSPSIAPSVAEIRDLVITVTRYPFDLEL